VLSTMMSTPRMSTSEIHTKLGSLRGKYESVKGKDTGVHAYLGVPFAKPPVGPALRLAAPQPVEGWEGVRDATQATTDVRHCCNGFHSRPSGCFRRHRVLYLNIYTPAKRPENAKLPVMVWIHGGGYVMGSASTYSGSALAAYQDVVVVLIQYHLGLLGFLRKITPFLDQIQSLKWVQEHIHNFGGDPDLVTIFGESAGGISVSLLLLSPLSEGLFHRAIAESGTVYSHKSINPSLHLSIHTDCIKNLDMETILTIAKVTFCRKNFYIYKFFICIFFNRFCCVIELLLQHQLLTVPFMTGVNNHEGSFLLAQVRICLYHFHLSLLLRLYLSHCSAYMLCQIVLGSYAGAPVYLYEFQHSPSFLKDKRPSFVKSDHGDEIYSVFGYCACSEEDEQLNKIMMSYWGNFARTGSPNGQGLVHWPKYGEKEDYLCQSGGFFCVKKEKLVIFWVCFLKVKIRQGIMF
uniref:Carboxylic ester hydrolase n=1 Tax=Takifugu rubripes TaxID=31033 RepID=H2RYP9_TAKRU